MMKWDIRNIMSRRRPQLKCVVKKFLFNAPKRNCTDYKKELQKYQVGKAYLLKILTAFSVGMLAPLIAADKTLNTVERRF